MFSVLAAVCTVYCAIEIVLITLHYTTILTTITTDESFTDEKVNSYCGIGCCLICTTPTWDARQHLLNE